MRRKVIFILLVLVSFVAYAQKKDKSQAPTPLKQLVRDAKASIKNSRDQAKNEKTLTDAMKRKDLSAADRAEIRYMQSLLNVSLNDAENMKAYLKQKYDTAAYFNTLLKACQYALSCDSFDVQPDAKGKVKMKHRTHNRELLLKHRPNLYAGGRFYLRKNDYAHSVPFFSTYIDMVKEPILEGNTIVAADSLLNRSAFYVSVAAYNNKQPKVVLQYIDRAIESAEAAQKPNLQEYKVRCLDAIGDTTSWLKALREGNKRYPKHDYFFSSIISYDDANRKYKEGLALADSMLSKVQDIPLYWYVKSVMYLRLNEYTKCIEMCDSVIARDEQHVDAWRNKGVCLLNQAIEFGETACYDIRKAKCREDRKKLTKYYDNARKPFERLRKLVPDRTDIWASPLYRIYLHLNMGKEFDEIERILKK